MTNANLEQLLPADFAEESRVWIFQSSRAFIAQEQLQIDEQLYQFYSQWQAHGEPVKGWAKLLYGQFVVVMADETGTHVSGCSTDGMMRVIKSLERQYDVNFFDRMMVTFLIKKKAEMLPYSQMQYAIDKGYITANTLMFNNVCNTKAELLEKWLVPVSESWVADKISLPSVP